MKSNPDCEMGELWGTSATSPNRLAPSSVSSILCSISSPFLAITSTTCPLEKVKLKPSIMTSVARGFVAVTTPSVLSLCVVVKTSSVGIFPTKGWFRIKEWDHYSILNKKFGFMFLW